jgi:hypothetical protein
MTRIRISLTMLVAIVPTISVSVSLPATCYAVQTAAGAQGIQAQADAAFDNGDWETALALYQEVLDSDPRGPFARRTLLRMARALAALGRSEEALARLGEFADGGANRAALAAVESSAELDLLRDRATYVAAVEALTPCSAPEYRQFDFWAGTWDVFAPNGQEVGHNVIEPILEGCGLREAWTSATGSRGTSYNFYDASNDKWHQTWIDDSGNPLYLEGKLDGGSMVLGDGTNRITWTPLPSGYVRQHWEITTDGGKTWTTTFDGEYRPATRR